LPDGVETQGYVVSIDILLYMYYISSGKYSLS
jgi:hypothetical protein